MGLNTNHQNFCWVDVHCVKNGQRVSKIVLGKMPRLNAEQRHRALGQLDAGRTVRAVAAAFGCSDKTIKSLRARVRQTGSVKRSSQEREAKSNNR